MYNKTCLIRHALGEKFFSGKDRVSNIIRNKNFKNDGEKDWGFGLVRFYCIWHDLTGCGLSSHVQDKPTWPILFLEEKKNQ